MTAGADITVVGGGLLGARVALLLAARGDRVRLLEAAPTLGGLASAWRLGDGPDAPTWDRYYHVTLMSDAHTREMLRELGLEEDVVWAAAQAGVYADGRLVPCSTPLDYLRLPSLSPAAKVRLALTILAGAAIRDGRKMESQLAADWLRRWSGREATERFWLPLLRAKLGDNADIASAAFIWATIQRLFKARRQGVVADKFGYVPGGYARTLDALATRLTEAGVEVRTGCRVSRVRAVEAGGVDVLTDGGDLHTDRVVLTTAAPLVAQLVEGMAPDAHDRYAGVTYQGIVCASLLLRRPLSPYYLTYVTDAAPFTAVVEMTALVDRAQLGGHALVYLPRYVPSDDPWLDKDDDSVRAELLPALQRIHPQLRQDDVLAFPVARTRYVMAVPTLGCSERLPPVRTGVPGVSAITSAHLVNATLNVDETLALADRLLPEAIA